MDLCITFSGSQPAVSRKQHVFNAYGVRPVQPCICILRKNWSKQDHITKEECMTETFKRTSITNCESYNNHMLLEEYKDSLRHFEHDKEIMYETLL